jgi:predicted dehydrogenase
MVSPTRRTFLASAAATAGALAVEVPAVHARGVNAKLNIGLIGCGNRGRTIAGECVKNGHRLVAVCDVAKFRFDALKPVLDKLGYAGKPDTYDDYRRLLDHKGLDAVIIATPDHHHRDQLLAAMAAGKHAYCEKPLGHTIEQGKEMVKAVRDAKKVVQVGNQRHSGEHWHRCRDVIQSPDFGDLVWVKVWDCRNWVKRDPFAPPKGFDVASAGIDWPAFLGNAPKRDFDPVRYFSWRWFWDYAGGLMTDIGAHQLDIVQWLGGADAPKSVVANGGVYHFRHWETPDVIHGVWDYGKFAATFAVEFVNGYDGVGCTFYGTKMTMHADADPGGEIRFYETIDRPTPSLKPKMAWKVENETPAHVKNWLDAVTANTDPHSTVELGHRVITAAHLANLSYRKGCKVFWDAAKEQVTTG